MGSGSEHPSNALYRGEVTSTGEALRVVQEMCVYEQSVSGTDCEDLRLAAMEARNIYAGILHKADNELAAWLRQRGGPAREILADAIESGDWARAAI